MKYTIKWEPNGKNAPIIWEKYEHQFPRLFPYDEFCCIFPYLEKFMGKPIYSPYAEVYYGWELDGKKATMLWEKYGYRFPRLYPYHRFCCIFPYCGKFMGKPMHFPYAELYHRMGIAWGKSTHAMGKVWVSVSQTFLIPWVLLHIPVLWEIYGEAHAFPICWSIP